MEPGDVAEAVFAGAAEYTSGARSLAWPGDQYRTAGAGGGTARAGGRSQYGATCARVYRNFNRRPERHAGSGGAADPHCGGPEAAAPCQHHARGGAGRNERRSG